jgi:glycosyltransferase involved in cell wall biosynthesis
MPVYNGEQFIKEALDSILRQTYRDFELVISDNASTDSTQEICEVYAAQDQRIRYYRNKQNYGAAENYNRVFKLSTGEYFKWASHDDLCAAEFLDKCVRVLENCASVVVCYPKTIVIDENGNHLENVFDDLELHSPRPHKRYEHYHKRFSRHRECNAIFGLIRAKTLNLTSLIGNYAASDEVLLGELALRGEFSEVPEHLFYRRNHPKMSTRTYSLKERAIWFDPTKEGKISLPIWRFFFEQLFSIKRVPMNFYEKIYCCALMGRWALWRWKKLTNELIIVFRNLLHLLSRIT